MLFFNFYANTFCSRYILGKANFFALSSVTESDKKVACRPAMLKCFDPASSMLLSFLVLIPKVFVKIFGTHANIGYSLLILDTRYRLTLYY